MRYGTRLAVIAVIALAAGFGVVAAALHDMASTPPTANSAPSTTPSSAPSGAPSGAPGDGPIPTPGPGETLQLEIGGKVTAVSSTSITLAAHGQSVTAAVTAATKVTGEVSGVGGIKVGDLVSAQITGTGGKLTASTIQDPASIP